MSNYPRHALAGQSFSVDPNSVLPSVESKVATPPQVRRPSSMQEIVADLFSDLISPGMMSWDYAPPPETLSFSPRVSRSPRQHRRDNDKGKQPVYLDQSRNISAVSMAGGEPSSYLDPIAYNYPPPTVPDIPGFMTIPGVGWACYICHNIVQQPALHTTNGIDFCLNAQWDPFNPMQPVPPQSSSIDEALARQQRMAGGIVARDFAAMREFEPPRLDWETLSGRRTSGTG